MLTEKERKKNKRVVARRPKYQLKGKNGVIALKMLKDVTDTFDSFGIRYWLDFGTLLGVVRENRILPWDTDMDISIHEDDREKVEKLVMPAIKKLSYRTYTRHLQEDSPALKKGDIRAFRVRNNRFGFFRGFVKIDIFVMYFHEDHFHWYELGAEHRFPAEYINEFEDIAFEGKMYNKPKNHDGYLSYHYGDWRTPDKNFIARFDNHRTLAQK